MITDEAVEAAWDAFSMGRDGMRAALEASAPVLAAQALDDAATVLEDLPVERMECYARIEEWKDGLNVDHGIQASVRWLKSRAEFIGGLAA